jgi:hypothetical protein
VAEARDVSPRPTAGAADGAAANVDGQLGAGRVTGRVLPLIDDLGISLVATQLKPALPDRRQTDPRRDHGHDDGGASVGDLVGRGAATC